MILPPALSLNGCQIVDAGNERRIRELCRNVEELDLASNGLDSLEEVLKIVKAMPNLRFLNLSENDFSALTTNHHRAADCSQSQNGSKSLLELKSLVLNNTRVPWPVVGRLLDSMPNLQELHLSLNNYTAMADIESASASNENLTGEQNRTVQNRRSYPNIRRLYISGNPKLSDWAEIDRLVATFPSLDVLTMADCNFETIPEDLECRLPSSVQSLNISNWPINRWEFVERLNAMPHLVELRCQGLEVLKAFSDQDARRYHLIARLPSVQVLNGSEISSDERIFAEKAFVRWYTVNDHVERPQRFFELKRVHGRVDPLAEVNMQPPKFADVTVIFNDAQQDASSESSSGSESNSEEASASPEPRQKHARQVKAMKVNVNKSVKDFKLQLRFVILLSKSSHSLRLNCSLP